MVSWNVKPQAVGEFKTDLKKKQQKKPQKQRFCWKTLYSVIEYASLKKIVNTRLPDIKKVRETVVMSNA